LDAIVFLKIKKSGEEDKHMWDPYAEFEKSVLSNQLSIYSTHWPGKTWEAMGFLVHSGAEQDPAGLEGLAHFVAHLVSASTGLGTDEIFAYFENFGGSVSLGRTSFADVSFYFVAPSDPKKIAPALDIFGKMLIEAQFDDLDLEKERRIIIEEFYQKFNLQFKYDLLWQEHQALYAGCWLQRSVCPIGRLDSIARIARSDLQAYYDEHYTPANISLVAIGGLSRKRIIGLISKSPLAKIKPGKRTVLPRPFRSVKRPLEKSQVFKLPDSAVNFGSYKTVARIPGSFSELSVSLLSKMLNRALIEEIRQKHGWAYDLDVSYQNFRHFYVFSVICPAFDLAAVDEIGKAVDACLASLASRADLLVRVKNHILASQRMHDPNGREVCSEALWDLSCHQRIISLREYRAQTKKVNINDIRNLLRWLAASRRRTLIVRP